MIKKINSLKVQVSEIDKSNLKLASRLELIKELNTGDFLELLPNSLEQIMVFNSNGEDIGVIPDSHYHDILTYINNPKIEIEAYVHNIKNLKTKIRVIAVCNVYELMQTNKDIPQKIIIQNVVDESKIARDIDKKYRKYYEDRWKDAEKGFLDKKERIKEIIKKEIEHEVLARYHKKIEYKAITGLEGCLIVVAIVLIILLLKTCD
ncbi:hypothetical protein [Riemerella anatipestifer]|uniref:HIRAN domain-containing protein n=1 Tax=Riemerella anatipestifer RA-CH-1 TaxID=1228997 RepID=J9QTN7_RIEAN|nr:hypothetical protein [Riemerella anatipestifer]AFR36236.1 hypothetical protein B739_1644 [Riemerella anatipestifer RA-CH-1]MCO7331990.1 hypothetical protein [Riemerella anatipestifer]MCO7350877.1 hypothetical protein [Riemerella anatipestifer]MCU7582384.1 hypothetical protein [Riemerella anatipestifer]MDD1553166.1 hypothetical protein [Riemerella anatipestifer]